jgi:outer membrane protein assembly factor BamB
VDKRSGKLLWKVAEDQDAGHKKVYGTGASVVIQQVAGKEGAAGITQVIVSVFRNDLMGVEAQTGKVLWHWHFSPAASSGMVPTPVVQGNRLLVSASQAATNYWQCLEMEIKDGGITPRLAYQSDRLQCNQYHTLSVWDGAVYGFGRGAERDALQCTNAADGTLLWQQETEDWRRDRQLTVADGLIFAVTVKEELVLLEASKSGYKELGRAKPGIKLGLPQQPIIANGRLYLRGDEVLVCYEVGK